MLPSLAWRNLGRNLRRSVLTGAAVGFGLMLSLWMRGLQDGSYVQMIDQAVRGRLGHLEVLAEGYLERPEPARLVPRADEVASRLRALDGVAAVTARAVGEGMVARDNESAPVELLGVRPADEARASDVPGKVLRGPEAEGFCRAELGDARELMDEDLFDRWCAAMAEGTFLPEGDERAVVVGAGLAERLLVSVGDELTVQVVRAVASDGLRAGEVSQRRLVVSGLVRTGNPEFDERLAYLQLETLTGMLGTDGPNEVVVLLEDTRRLEDSRAEVRRALEGIEGLAVHTWGERNPSLRGLIEMDSQSGNVMYVVLFLLIALGVVNATLMSVLERTKEFGIMLALGVRRGRLFALVMLEVAMLGVVSIVGGSILGGALELFGRRHGWPIEWFGYESMEGQAMAGIVYERIFYSGLRPENGLAIVLGVYLMFLLAGLLPAIRAARLAPVSAMRAK